MPCHCLLWHDTGLTERSCWEMRMSVQSTLAVWSTEIERWTTNSTAETTLTPPTSCQRATTLNTCIAMGSLQAIRAIVGCTHNWPVRAVALQRAITSSRLASQQQENQKSIRAITISYFFSCAWLNDTIDPLNVHVVIAADEAISPSSAIAQRHEKKNICIMYI